MHFLRSLCLIAALATCSAETIEFFGRVDTIDPLSQAGGVNIGDPYYARLDYVVVTSEEAAFRLSNQSGVPISPLPALGLWAVLMSYQVIYPWGQQNAPDLHPLDGFLVEVNEMLEPIAAVLVPDAGAVVQYEPTPEAEGSWFAFGNLSGTIPEGPPAFFEGTITSVNKVWSTVPAPEPSTLLLLPIGLALLRVLRARRSSLNG